MMLLHGAEHHETVSRKRRACSLSPVLAPEPGTSMLRGASCGVLTGPCWS